MARDSTKLAMNLGAAMAGVNVTRDCLTRMIETGRYTLTKLDVEYMVMLLNGANGNLASATDIIAQAIDAAEARDGS